MIVSGTESSSLPSANTTLPQAKLPPLPSQISSLPWHARKFRTWVESSEILSLLVNITGGRTSFLRSLGDISDSARPLHKNTSVTYFDLVDRGQGGVIGLLDFSDKERWAVKIGAYNVSDQVKYGVNVMKMLEKYCPEIPVPRVHGELTQLGNLSYYFMDWVPGKIMSWDCRYKKVGEEVDPKGERSLEKWNVSIPEGIMKQLVEAAYNLTNCPIPREEGTFLYRESGGLM